MGIGGNSVVPVVLLWHLAPPLVGQLSEFDRRLLVRDASREARAELSLERDKGNPSQLAEARSRLSALLQEAEVLLALRLPSDLLRRAPRLRWIQLVSAGIDRSTSSGLLQANVVITTASGVAAINIAEYVIGAMVMLAKGMPGAFRNQQKGIWERFVPGELYGKTVGIVGLGHIGKEVAPRAKAFGMRVIASRRSAIARQANIEGVGELFPASQLRQLLSLSDFVVLAVPLTPETRGFIGEEELRAMKPTACLVNISRGEVVDEAAIVAALKEGRLAGAALDVFRQEPLPAESELWGLPNVIVTPHISGFTPEYDARLTQVFQENLRRYLRGEELVNLVDRKRGY